MVCLDDFNENVELGVRNLTNAFVTLGSHISVYDVLDADTLVVTEATIKGLEEAHINA